MAYPSDRKYTKDHEWIRSAGDTAEIGITDYAQRQLGDVVYVELPDVGKTIAAGESFGCIESVKAVSELFSPLAGEVVEINGRLDGEPALVNSDPYGAGWMIRLKPDDAGAVDSLMDAAGYSKHLG
jgi:glycine cleavage system H protein